MVWRLLLAAISLVVVGCSPMTATSRIFSNRPVATVVIPVGQPLSVGLEQLQQAPEAYDGTLVRISGEFRRAPIVVCDGIVRQPPATWRLAQGEQFIGAGGYDSLVPVLLPSGLTITVDGVWRFWRGPVGCGKEAPVQIMWYLAVTNIVSPSPVARVTLTPPGGASIDTPAPTTTEFEGETVTPAEETPAGPPPIGTPAQEPSPTVRPTSAPGPTQPASTAAPATTAAPSPSATAEDDGEEEDPFGTLTATATLNGTSAATATTAGGPTSTATATSGPTSTPGGTVIDKGSVDYQDLRGGRMAANETNSWQFAVQAGDVITISVVARAEADIVLTVLDPAGNRVVQQNEGGAGEIERIEALEAQSSGGFRVVISEASGSETYYVMLILNVNSDDPLYYPFRFAGMLSYGTSASANLAEAVDQFWFFFGNAQEVVNINVAPTDNGDLFLDLFDPEGELLEGDIDSAGAGGSEQMRNFVLPATGIYSIRVGEFQYNPSSFTILVSRN